MPGTGWARFRNNLRLEMRARLRKSSHAVCSMNHLNRRQFLQTTATWVGGAVLGTPARSEAAGSPRKMTISLSCGSIGVSADQVEAIRLATKYGFESVEASTEYLARLPEAELTQLISDMKAQRVVFGTAGLPVEFRQDEAKFKDSLKGLPRMAEGLHRAGVDRVGTWLMPGDNSRTYLENYKLHARRLREVASVLKDHGQRLGLEYVGTKTSRERSRYQFVHSLAELKELIAEIGTGNVGVVLDSWHWWQADDTVADLLTLKNQDIVSVDLNDAPAGPAKEKQIDGQRELPCATGVIDLAAFLKALNQIGYDGPVRAEPFNKALNDLKNDEACAATIAAMKKAFALIT
jgi:sugar phosphate isomerase/epimerase